MLSKEEIEDIKKIIYPLSIEDFITWFTTDGCIKVELATKRILEYIEQLENENNMFKKFHINCGKEDIAEHITATQYSKIRMEGYWEGYIQKQKEAIQICKQCKYIKKSKELEIKQQKLIEKLEEDIEYYECDLLRIKQIGLDENDEQVITDKILIDKFKEILEILKGENDE